MRKFNNNWNQYLTEEDFDRSKLSIKEKLNTKFWTRGKLQEDISERLLEIAEEFYSSVRETINNAPEIEDIIFTGSLASYNYHNSSDIDLHIVVNFEDIGEAKDILAEFFALKRIQWNKSHNIYIHNHEVEIYIQDSNEEHFANGIYSISSEEWLEMPVKENVDIDFKSAEKKYESISLEIKELSKLFRVKEYQKVYDHASKLKQKIKFMRNSGLEHEGVYSPENLAFKMLRNNDQIKDLMSLRINSYDKKMSIGTEGPSAEDLSESWRKFAKGSKI